MTPDEKHTGVERLKPWFHRIDLGDGVVTKTASVAGEPADHPLPTWAEIARVLPDDLSGKSVLDVGCNAGFYAVEAKRRGAARVLGVDSQRHQVRQASFVVRALGLPIEFRRMSVYDLSPETVGIFDVTLALGLVYHLKHLVQGLERLYSVTGELLILETAVLLPTLVPTNAVPYVTGPLERTLHPIGYVANSPDAKEAVYNWFVPSVGAIGAMLSDTGFADVQCVATPGDRAVFVCRKDAASRVPVLPDLAARLSLVSAPERCRPGEGVTLTVRVSNAGRSPWLARGGDGGRGAVAIGAHLFRDDEEVDWLWAREALPGDVAAGGSVELRLEAVAPLGPARYRVEVDMVAEHVAWFEDLGSELLEVGLAVFGEQAPVPWYRVAGVEEGVASRGAAGASEGSYADLLRAAAQAISADSPQEKARFVLAWTAGWRPQPAAVDDLAGPLSTGAATVAGALHALAGRPDRRPVPPAPPVEVCVALSGRAPAAPPSAIPLSGESFPGEADVARGLLSEGASVNDEAFVQRAYAVILGRSADMEGLTNACEQLVSHAMTRTHFLHELLWSEELRKG